MTNLLELMILRKCNDCVHTQKDAKRIVTEARDNLKLNSQVIWSKGLEMECFRLIDEMRNDILFPGVKETTCCRVHHPTDKVEHHFSTALRNDDQKEIEYHPHIEHSINAVSDEKLGVKQVSDARLPQKKYKKSELSSSTSARDVTRQQSSPKFLSDTKKSHSMRFSKSQHAVPSDDTCDQSMTRSPVRQRRNSMTIRHPRSKSTKASHRIANKEVTNHELHDKQGDPCNESLSPYSRHNAHKTTNNNKESRHDGKVTKTSKPDNDSPKNYGKRSDSRKSILPLDCSTSQRRKESFCNERRSTLTISPTLGTNHGSPLNRRSLHTSSSKRVSNDTEVVQRISRRSLHNISMDNVSREHVRSSTFEPSMNLPTLKTKSSSRKSLNLPGRNVPQDSQKIPSKTQRSESCYSLTKESKTRSPTHQKSAQKTSTNTKIKSSSTLLKKGVERRAPIPESDVPRVIPPLHRNYMRKLNAEFIAKITNFRRQRGPEMIRDEIEHMESYDAIPTVIITRTSSQQHISKASRSSSGTSPNPEVDFLRIPGKSKAKSRASTISIDDPVRLREVVSKPKSGHVSHNKNQITMSHADTDLDTGSHYLVDEYSDSVSSLGSHWSGQHSTSTSKNDPIVLQEQQCSIKRVTACSIPSATANRNVIKNDVIRGSESEFVKDQHKDSKQQSDKGFIVNLSRSKKPKKLLSLTSVSMSCDDPKRIREVSRSKQKVDLQLGSDHDGFSDIEVRSRNFSLGSHQKGQSSRLVGLRTNTFEKTERDVRLPNSKSADDQSISKVSRKSYGSSIHSNNTTRTHDQDSMKQTTMKNNNEGKLLKLFASTKSLKKQYHALNNDDKSCVSHKSKSSFVMIPITRKV